MGKKSKIILIFFLISIFLLTGFFCRNFKLIDIGGKKFIAELALTKKSQERGLGKRSKLCRNCAMLFDFGKEGKYPFSMRGMLFNLDMLWISNGKIVHIEKNVSFGLPSKIDPNVGADKVLEINAELSDEYEFKIGDKVELFP